MITAITDTGFDAPAIHHSISDPAQVAIYASGNQRDRTSESGAFITFGAIG